MSATNRIEHIARAEKVLGMLLLLTGAWLWADSYFEVLGPDRHGFALLASLSSGMIGVTLLLAGH